MHGTVYDGVAVSIGAMWYMKKQEVDGSCLPQALHPIFETDSPTDLELTDLTSRLASELPGSASLCSINTGSCTQCYRTPLLHNC